MAKKSTKEEFIIKSKKIHGDYYSYENVNYINNDTYVKIICPFHGEFEQKPRNHTSGMKCILCNYDNYKLSNDNFIERSNKLHNNKYDYSNVNYLGMDIPIIITCKIHGNFIQTPMNHLKGSNCIKCNNDIRINKYYEKFLITSKLIHKNKYDYSNVNYINKDTHVDIICQKHGIFKQSPNNHIRGKGCPICSESKGEKQIRIFLENNNIKFISQHKFKDCFHKKKLCFDFYLPEYNVCIEFNGIQHYIPITYFGGEEKLFECQTRDNIKVNYCLNNNINLIVINYTDNIESELINLINRITIIT